MELSFDTDGFTLGTQEAGFAIIMEIKHLLHGTGKQMVLEYQILTEVLHQQYQLIQQVDLVL
jgi:hypothetical protein